MTLYCLQFAINSLLYMPQHDEPPRCRFSRQEFAPMSLLGVIVFENPRGEARSIDRAARACATENLFLANRR